MDIDSLKQDWRKAGEEMDCRDNGIGAGFNARRQTSLDRLARRYRIFSLVAFLFAGNPALYMLSTSSRLGGTVPMWLVLCMEAFFLGASCLDYWLYRGVRSIDTGRMTVEEVIRKSMFYRKRHLQFILVLLPLALAMIAGLAYCFKADRYMIFAITGGFLFGVALGVRALLEFLHDYRDIMKE